MFREILLVPTDSQEYKDYQDLLIKDFDLTVNAFIETFEMCLIAIVMPCKTILFTVHNYLTKRDYSYSIDDICDLGILICIIVWVYTYFHWSV